MKSTVAEYGRIRVVPIHDKADESNEGIYYLGHCLSKMYVKQELRSGSVLFHWVYQYQWRALVNSLSSAHYLKATPIYIQCLFLKVSLSSFIFLMTVSWQLCAFSNIRPGLVRAYKRQCHYDPVVSANS